MNRHMDLRAIGFAGDRRAKLLDAAEEELTKIVDEVIEAGDNANIRLAARVSGVPRRTLYRRLQAREREGSTS